MDYEAKFRSAIDTVRDEGRYRVFADLKRRRGAYPRADYVADMATGQGREITVWCSNDYLGMSQHPAVITAMHEAIDKVGAGSGGTRNIAGTNHYHVLLEAELADLHGKEAGLLFTSGYISNSATLSTMAMALPGCVVFSDALNHASMIQGIRGSKAERHIFRHNDPEHLRFLLGETKPDVPKLIAFESVYSMDGDMAPLDQVVQLCKKYGAILVVDDAHGTGASGPGGSGSAQQFGVHGDVDIILGSFSKSFCVSGGFVACSKAVADYLRMFSRAYIFSSSIPPMTVAAVHAVLDLLENEPEIHARLRENIGYLVDGLRKLGFDASDETAVIPLPVPLNMNIRAAAHAFHKRGIFLNHLEYPAVPVSRQRFRISLMATQTKDDINQLLTAVKEVWEEFAPPTGDGLATPEPTPAAVQPDQG